jgi:hypothetical protein
MLASGADDHAVKLWDPATGQELRTLSGHSDWVTGLAFSPDGKTLASGGFDDKIKFWDVSGGSNIRTIDGQSGPIGALAFSNDGTTVASANGDDSVALWDVGTGNLLHKFVGHTNDVNDVAFTPDGKILVSASTDGTARLWTVSTGEQRAALIAFTDGSSLAVTPVGFFNSSSEQAEENLNVRINDRVVGIASFRETFYRPDLVQKALEGEDVSHYGSIDNVELSPVVEFENLPATETSPNLKMTLKLTNGGGGFGPVRVFWNGTVIQQDSDLPTLGDTLTRSYSVPLLGGNNELRATAFNSDGSMWSDAHASVTANLPPLPKTATAHGTLHAIVIGIKDFPKATEHNLKYPVADAALIAKTLNEKAGPLFQKLDVQLLTATDQTDKAHIVQALQAMQAAAKPDDEFVFYAASHGIVVDNQYYIATSDIDPAKPADLAAHALSAKELSDLLANIHAAKKLVILDTCDAGAASEALGANAGVTTQTAATILGRSYGFTVLAATASNQEALEGGYKDHGLFTYVVNDGLSGKAADAATGVVSTFLLADYVDVTVPTLAQTVLHRAQQPTAQKSGQTFSVTKVR